MSDISAKALESVNNAAFIYQLNTVETGYVSPVCPAKNATLMRSRHFNEITKNGTKKGTQLCHDSSSGSSGQQRVFFAFPDNEHVFCCPWQRCSRRLTQWFDQAYFLNHLVVLSRSKVSRQGSHGKTSQSVGIVNVFLCILFHDFLWRFAFEPIRLQTISQSHRQSLHNGQFVFFFVTAT